MQSNANAEPKGRRADELFHQNVSVDLKKKKKKIIYDYQRQRSVTTGASSYTAGCIRELTSKLTRSGGAALEPEAAPAGAAAFPRSGQGAPG